MKRLVSLALALTFLLQPMAAMADGRELATKNFRELSVLAGSSVNPAADYIPVYDASAYAVKKVLATPTMVGLTATASEINNVADISARVVSATGATVALDGQTYDSKTILLNKADGQAVTLDPATGSGVRHRIVVGTTITSVGTTIKVTGNDVMYGTAFADDDDGEPSNGWATAVDSDTITLTGTTTGGYAGDIIELEDVAADKWVVSMTVKQTGTEATPFSATVP